MPSRVCRRSLSSSNAELVARDAEGRPSFAALMSGASRGCCAYVFDLLQDDAEIHTAAPMEYRRPRLRELINRSRADALRFSDDFDDPVELLDACARQGLEGIVSKLPRDRYTSGTQ